MLGWIMPAPFVMPARENLVLGKEGRVNWREMSLGKVSVVQMAFAVPSQWSCVLPSFDTAVGILSRILVIGRLSIGKISNKTFTPASHLCSSSCLPLPYHSRTHNHTTQSLPIMRPLQLSIHHLPHLPRILQPRLPRHSISTPRIHNNSPNTTPLPRPQHLPRHRHRGSLEFVLRKHCCCRTSRF